MRESERWKRVAVVGTVSGVVGWGVENIASKAGVLAGQSRPWRFSAAFRGAPVPFLPVYAAGGATVAAVAPAMRASGLPWPVRGASYALLLAALEWGACKIDRHALGARSWDYGDGEDDSIDGDGCVNDRLALAWGALGLLVERLATR